MTDERLLESYSKQTESEIAELNKIIVALRSKIVMLTEALEGERARSELIPVPPSVISQVASMHEVINKKQEEIDYYKKYVSDSVIINKERIVPPTRKGGLR